MAVLIGVKTDYPVNERELSNARLQRAKAYKNPDDRRRCLCAGVALDKALSTIGLREKQVVFVYNTHGKPYLAEHPEWHFNLSHSGEWAVCALSRETVGVDIERHRIVPMESLAKRYFSDQEVRRLHCLPPSAQTQEFFRLWTRKESLLKAAGIGLGGLSSVREEGYSFREYALEGYSLTVCGTDLPNELMITE